MAADNEAPQRVLQVIRESVPDGNNSQKDKPNESKKHFKTQKEEERKFGVFYDDDYNYMQHLKDRKVPEYDWSEMDNFLLEAPKILIPSDEKRARETLSSKNKKQTDKVGKRL